MARKIKIENLTAPKNLYPRSKYPTEENVVGMPDPSTLPPIVVAKSAEHGVVVVDGMHRITRARALGIEKLAAENLGEMTDAEILQEAIKYNASHGKQLSLQEKARAARSMLGEMKQQDLAKLFAVSERTVSRWLEDDKAAKKIKTIRKLKKLRGGDKPLSWAACEKKLGVKKSTLQGWMKEDPDEVEAKVEEKKAKKEEKKKAKPADQSVDFSEECLDEIANAATEAIKDVVRIAKLYGNKKVDVAYEVARLIVDKF